MSFDQLQLTYQQIAPVGPYLIGAAGLLMLVALARLVAPRGRAARGRLSFDRCVIPLVGTAVVALGAGSLYTSFVKVSELAGTPLPGLLIDGAIGVFTVIEITLARKGKRLVWMARLQWLLIGCTVVANAWGEPNVALMLLHGCQPVLWKASVAGLKALILDQAAIVIDDRIPARRWLQSPVGTFWIWRWIVLGRVATYSDALVLDGQIAALRLESKGWDACPREKVLYQALTGQEIPVTIEWPPSGVQLAARTAPVPAIAEPALELQPAESVPPAPPAITRRPTQPRKPRSRHRRQSARVPDVDLDVVGRVRQAVDTLGVPVVDATRDQVLEHLRATPEGGVHATKVGAALRHLRETTP